jgi:hypothetical protein
MVTTVNGPMGVLEKFVEFVAFVVPTSIEIVAEKKH